MNITKNKKGVSLVELVVYFAIIGIVLLAAMNFAVQVINSSERSKNYNELQGNIDFISNKIISAIKSAESINDANSLFDSDAGSLALDMHSPASTPVTFYISDGDVYFAEGISAEIKLNSDYTKVKLFRFHKVTYPKTPDQIVMDIELEPVGVEYTGTHKDVSLHLSVSTRNL